MAVVEQTVLFENDRVRVLEMTLQPGDSTGMHTHDLDYMFYPTSSATLHIRRPDKEYDVVAEAGKVFYREKGDTHEAINASDSPYHEIEIQLK